MNKYKKHIISFFSLSLSLIGFFIYYKFDWWILGAISDFKIWHPNTAYLLFALKIIFVALSIFSLTYVLALLSLKAFILFKKIPNYYKFTFGLFTIYLILAPIFNGHHPFSSFPMYNVLSTWAYNFELVDKDDKIIPYKLISNYTSVDAPDIYEAYMRKNNFPYGNDLETMSQLNQAGNFLLPLLVDEQKRISMDIDYIQLNRINYTIKNGSIIKLKTKLSEKVY